MRPDYFINLIMLDNSRWSYSLQVNDLIELQKLYEKQKDNEKEKQKENE